MEPKYGKAAVHKAAAAGQLDQGACAGMYMVQGCRDALLVMINSEPYGDGYTKPAYLDWAR